MAPTWRKMNYLESTTKNFDFAKDIRLFNMSNAFFNQLSGVNETYKELNRKHHNRMVLWEVSLGSVLLIQKVLMYTWLVYNVVTGAYQISDFVLYVGLVTTFHNSVGYVNWIYSSIRGNCLMINDYRNFIAQGTLMILSAALIGIQNLLMMIIFIVISFGIVKISSFFTKRDKIKF